MTRSHVLLHRPDDRLRSARVEAWEGGIRALPANHAGRGVSLHRFPELSGVGRVTADRMDEDGARDAAMDELIMCEAEDFLCWGPRQGPRPWRELHAPWQ
jgi:hypothetical protein